VLAPQLPLPIPTPVAQGEPDEGYPYRWSVYRWLEGSLAASELIADPVAFATDLAGFLRALAAIDATGGPGPGQHNFFRGGPLAYYEGEALEAIERLGDEISRDAVQRTWADAMASEWERDPVWFHGDVAVGNLLVRDPPLGAKAPGLAPSPPLGAKAHSGRLAAVLDFGSSGVGDPACDMAIAWTFLSGEARDRFRAERGVDAATWSRGRGWTLWKSLITMVGALDEDDDEAVAARRREIDVITADFAAER
jgi:aminoglycoside phosphotransferase (APT) family kinase protein